MSKRMEEARKLSNKNWRVCVFFAILAVVFTFLVKFVDVRKIGPNYSEVGLATINRIFRDIVGSNMSFYKITSILGIILFLIVFAYIIIGIVQAVKRKSLKKVDREIWFFGLFCVLTASVYLLFDKFIIINYRPVLIDGSLNPSYPSTHTLLAAFICLSAVTLNKRLFGGGAVKFINFLLVILMLAIIGGRILSGVHWFTDITGGFIMALALLYGLRGAIFRVPRAKSKEEKTEIEIVLN